MQTINNFIINRKNSFNYNYNLNDKDILKYFDIKKFALLIASNLVWGEVHSYIISIVVLYRSYIEN